MTLLSLPDLQTASAETLSSSAHQVIGILPFATLRPIIRLFRLKRGKHRITMTVLDNQPAFLDPPFIPSVLESGQVSERRFNPGSRSEFEPHGEAVCNRLGERGEKAIRTRLNIDGMLLVGQILAPETCEEPIAG